MLRAFATCTMISSGFILRLYKVTLSIKNSVINSNKWLLIPVSNNVLASAYLAFRPDEEYVLTGLK